MAVVHKQAFVTSDGRAFDTQDAAQRHERSFQIEMLNLRDGMGGFIACDFPHKDVRRILLYFSDRIAEIVAATPLASPSTSNRSQQGGI